MPELLRRNRFLLLRRISQISVLGLFAAGNVYGWKVLRGNLSSSRLLDAVPLSDPFALLQVAATGHLVARDAIIGGITVLAFFAVLGGRAFCGWICPMNMVTDLAGLVRGRLEAPAAGTTSMPRISRYWILGLSLILSAALGIAAFEWVSPIANLHRGLIFGMGAGWTAVAAVFLFDILVVRHGFCGHLCPLGAFYSLAGRYSLIRVRHRAERCTQCMQCLEHCPERQVLPMVGTASGPVTSGECTNCAKCIDVCREDAMSFGLRTGSTKQPVQTI